MAVKNHNGHLAIANAAVSRFIPFHATYSISSLGFAALYPTFYVVFDWQG